MKRKSLEFIEHDLSIPPPLIEWTEEYRHCIGHRDIDAFDCQGITLIVSPGACCWHTDDDICNFSALLVVKNDAPSYVQVRNNPVVVDQPIGTLMLLNTRKLHRLAYAKEGVPARFKSWMAVCHDYECEKHPSHEQCIEDMRGILTNIK